VSKAPNTYKNALNLKASIVESRDHLFQAITKNNRGFRPEWAGSEPGQHPMLPTKPPGRR
jgi:hypothetical protein